jgi:hypothetical protein
LLLLSVLVNEIELFILSIDDPFNAVANLILEFDLGVNDFFPDDNSLGLELYITIKYNHLPYKQNSN